MKSLAYHGARRDGLRTDCNQVEFDSLVSEMVQLYRAASWRLPDDFLTKEHYGRIVREKIHWQSSPGYPYCLNSPTNEAFFEVKDGQPSALALERVWCLVKHRLGELDCDPIKLFVKPEPHSARKIQRGAFRLISSVSVIDQIIDQMLFAPMNDAIVENYMLVPSKIGWSPYKRGYAMVPPNWISIDKSSWDWSVQPWIFEVILQVRAELCINSDSPAFERWEELAKFRYKKLFGEPIFVTSGGVLLKQREPGVQKSGCVNTISDNSMAQDILHLRVCREMGVKAPAQWSVGDDTYGQPVDDMRKYINLLSQYSHVKSADRSGEFVGFSFKNGIQPMYVGKHAFNILHVRESVVPEFVPAYHLLYAKGRMPAVFLKALNQLGQNPGKSWLRLIWEGED